MKLKMLTRMAAMVAAGSLVVGLLAGCSVIPSKDGAADSAVATDTALILTQGDGMPTLTNAEDFLNSVNVTPGGSAGLVVADGKPFALGPQRFDQVKNNDIQQARADKAARLELVEAVQGAAAKTPETDLVTAVSLASRMLSAGTADTKVMVIPHSGVNTAASLPMQDLDLLNSDPAKLLDQLDAAAMLPQLNGVAVEFYGLGDVAGSQGTLSAQQVQWLKSFWQAFFDRMGAAVTFHTDIVSGDASTTATPVTPLAAAGAPTLRQGQRPSRWRFSPTARLSSMRQLPCSTERSGRAAQGHFCRPLHCGWQHRTGGQRQPRGCPGIVSGPRTGRAGCAGGGRCPCRPIHLPGPGQRADERAQRKRAGEPLHLCCGRYHGPGCGVSGSGSG